MPPAIRTVPHYTNSCSKPICLNGVSYPCNMSLIPGWPRYGNVTGDTHSVGMHVMTSPPVNPCPKNKNWPQTKNRPKNKNRLGLSTERVKNKNHLGHKQDKHGEH